MSQAPNNTEQNTPNAALAYTAFSTVFGNYNFMVTPATRGKVDLGFPTTPYLSLEALLFSQASANPAVSPTSIISGVSSGQQSVGGQTTTRDTTGTTRVSDGFT